jgi:hypothetical protein
VRPPQARRLVSALARPSPIDGEQTACAAREKSRATVKSDRASSDALVFERVLEVPAPAANALFDKRRWIPPRWAKIGC